jgi:hypothetical protein
MYPLDSIKAEDLGSQLAEAVDGLKLAHDVRVQECCQLGEGCPRLFEVGELD